MKKIAIIIFDDFTDIDLFLMWDLLGRKKSDFEVNILGQQAFHRSSNGLSIKTHGHIAEAINADVVLFSSGKGTRAVIGNDFFLKNVVIDTNRQIIGSICSGALIMAKLGLLKGLTATTHPGAKVELQALGVDVIDQPLVCHGNIATAGGCLSALYLVGWVVEKIYGMEKREEVLKEVMPVGQRMIYEKLISDSLQQGMCDPALPRPNLFSAKL